MNRTGKRILFASAGLALFAILIRHIGWSTMLHQLSTLRVSLPILIGIGVIRLVLQSRNWAWALAADDITVSPARLAGMRLASMSLSYLSAMGPVVAEPAKLALLRSDADAVKAAPATLAETVIYWFSSVLLGLSGILAGGVLLGRGSHSTSGLWICAGAFVGATPLLMARRSLLGRLGDRLGRWRAPLPSWLRKGAEIEEGIRSFRHRHPRVAARLFVVNLVSQVLMVMEVTAVLVPLGIRADFVTVLAIEAVARASKMASAWVPARLGVDETGTVGACVMFGVNPAAGLTLSLARRARDLLWCVAGMAWLGLIRWCNGTSTMRCHASDTL